MSLLHFDGFEGIAIGDIGLRGWTGVNNSPGGTAGSGAIIAGLNGNGLRITNGMANPGQVGAFRYYQTIPDRTTVIFGAAYRKPAFVNGNDVGIFAVWEGGTCHCTVTVNSTGVFKAYRGRVNGTVLGSSDAGLYTTNQWVFLEAIITVSDTVGAVQVIRDGTTILNLTNVDTRDGATGVINQLALENSVFDPFTGQQSADFDDVYLLDNGGAAPYNAPLGPIRVDRLLSTADVGTPGFTPSAGANWQNVDETSPDNDTTYNESGVAGAKDVFEMGDLVGNSGTIFAVATRTRVRRTDADTIALIPSIISNGVEADGANRNLSASYEEHTNYFTQNPDGSVPWTDSTVNAVRTAYRVPT